MSVPTILDDLTREPLGPGLRAYFRERQRLRLYELVVREFHASGLTRAQLGRRLGLDEDRVRALLGAPGDWGLDLVSDLLLAISAGELAVSVSSPIPGRDAPG